MTRVILAVVGFCVLAGCAWGMVSAADRDTLYLIVYVAWIAVPFILALVAARLIKTPRLPLKFALFGATFLVLFALSTYVITQGALAGAWARADMKIMRWIHG